MKLQSVLLPERHLHDEEHKPHAGDRIDDFGAGMPSGGVETTRLLWRIIDMQATTLLRQQFREFHQLLEETLAGVTVEQLHSVPPGTANPAGATYAHVVLWEDMGVHTLLQGCAPLSAGSWAGRIGLSELPPLDRPGHWEDWARRVRVDLEALRSYAGAVHEATDRYFASLPEAELERDVDLTAMGFGRPSAAWVITNMLQNVALHCGEIAVLKGLLGQPGYPLPARESRETAAE